jgi:hypothetical protein
MWVAVFPMLIAMNIGLPEISYLVTWWKLKRMQ